MYLFLFLPTPQLKVKTQVHTLCLDLPGVRPPSIKASPFHIYSSGQSQWDSPLL